MDFNLYVHVRHTYTLDDESAARLRRIEDKLTSIYGNEETIMHTLDEDLALATEQRTQLDSLNAVMISVRQRLQDALSGATLPAAVQQKVDSVFDLLTTNNQQIVTAINTNTDAHDVDPAAPGPEPSPAPDPGSDTGTGTSS